MGVFFHGNHHFSMMGSKDREGPKPGYCQVFPQSAVGFWVMALEAEGDKATGSLTIDNHSKGNDEVSRCSAQTRRICVLSETPKAWERLSGASQPHHPPQNV